MFWPIVNPELGASENMVLTWPLDFCLPAYFCLKKSIFAPKLIFLINFITVLWFIWDLVLVLFESQKDVVSGKILVFGNILGFPRVIGPKNGPKPSTLGTSKTTSGRNFSKLVPYLVGGGGGMAQKRIPPPKKKVVLWILHRHKNVWTLSLGSYKCLFNETYHKYVPPQDVKFRWRLGCNSWGVRRHKPKTSQNEPENQFFCSISGVF